MNDVDRVLGAIATLNPVPQADELPHGAVTTAALLATIDEKTAALPTPSSAPRTQGPSRSRVSGVPSSWIVAVSAAAVVLLLIGGLGLLLRSDSGEVVDQPTGTTVPPPEPAVPTTLVEPPPTTAAPVHHPIAPFDEPGTIEPAPVLPIPAVIYPDLIQPEVSAFSEIDAARLLHSLTSAPVRPPIATEGALWVPVDRNGTDWVSRVDAETLQVTDTIEMHGRLYFAADALWAVDEDTNTVTRVDPVTREVTDTIQLPGAEGRLRRPLFLDETLWLYQGDYRRARGRDGPFWYEIDLAAREITKAWPVVFGPDVDGYWWAEAIDGNIWMVVSGPGASSGIYRFDTQTGETDNIPIGDYPGPADECCMISDDAIWLPMIPDEDDNDVFAGPFGVARFDLNTLEITDTYDLGDGVVGDGAIWLLGPYGAIYRIDTTSRQITDRIPYRVPPGSDPIGWTTLSITDDALSVFDHRYAVLTRVDLEFRQATYTIQIPETSQYGYSWPPLILEDVVWLWDSSDLTLKRIELP